jgi:hypothetical protein
VGIGFGGHFAEIRGFLGDTVMCDCWGYDLELRSSRDSGGIYCDRIGKSIERWAPAKRWKGTSSMSSSGRFRMERWMWVSSSGISECMQRFPSWSNRVSIFRSNTIDSHHLAHMISDFPTYLRGGWGVPKMIMWWSQDQEISPSKWVNRDHAGNSLILEYFTMKKKNQHI